MKYVPIVPSTLLDLDRSDEAVDAFMKGFSDTSLKVGIILKAYDIEDENNINKETVEYDVLCFIQDKDLGQSAIIYKNCITADMFGGMGDFLEFRRRVPTKDPLAGKGGNEKDQFKFSDGSFVLLLAANGIAESGIIVGSIKHPQRKVTITKEAEIHMEGEYNGVHLQINKDGELTITYKSPTKADGKFVDEEKAKEVGGSFIKLDKEGSIELNDAKKEKIKIDKKNKEIVIEAEKNIKAKTETESVTFESGKDFSVKSKANLVLEAEGSATLKSGGPIKIQSDAALEMKGSSIKIESDSQLQMKGNFVQIEGTQVMIGSSPQPALVLTTQFMGVGNLGAPVISAPIGPFSSSVFISA